MAADEKWYFTKEQLATTPSRKSGFDADKELSYRQQAANFIQDMGQRLSVSQLCINTAIVYMHRFYVFHSLSSFHRNAIASAALFLAAKVEEQPRKLEHVIKVAHLCLHRDQPPLDTKSEQYLEQAQDLVFNENVLLQTLGFDVAIDHPHTHVVRCCHLVKASKDLAQTSYFMASNSLHLTTMCLQYKPTVVACFCIHLACKWSNWEIPQSNEGKHWFWYVDRTVTSELLQQLTAEFLHIFDRCPSRLKRKIMSISANQSPNMSHPSLPSSPFDMEPRKIQSPVNALDGGPVFQSNRPHHDDKKAASASGRPPVDYREYREKKERERLDREKAAAAGQGHAHHHKPVPTTGQIPGKHPVPQPGQKPHVHHNHHHVKPGAQVPASQLGPASGRHSLTSQQRESVARQRVPREYNSSSGTSGGTVFAHGHGATDGTTADARTEQNLSADTAQDKQANNSHAAHHSADNKHLQPTASGDTKRQYDPARHKPPEHRKEESQKLYGKYNQSNTEAARIERQRKQPDILEQRSEEVRKLIEKPIMLPMTAQKTRQEIQKEEYAANMVKQSHHHAKYPHEKLQGNPVVVLNQMKPPFGTREKSPQTIAKAGGKPVQGGSYSHHVSQTSKDGVRNGNTTPAIINLEDIKTEKKPEVPPYSATPPGAKHRSLFSPEKTIAGPRESGNSQRSKPKQKMEMRSVKQEPIGVKLPTELMSHFANPNLQMEHTTSFKRSVSETATSSSNKRHRASSICEPEQAPRIKEEPRGIEAMKMIGRVPDLIQPIRDNPTSSNGKNSSVANDLKPPEIIKPFEPEPIATSAGAQGAVQQPVSNGYDLSRINQDAEYLSPLKSARGISALLQETTIQPLPSILQQQQMQSSRIDNIADRIGEATVGASATVQTTTTTTTVTTVTEEKRSEHHKSEKKKKKDKHKHKDKDKGKEERKHKHKHKDREKDRHHRDKESRGGGGDDGSNVTNSGVGGAAQAIPIKITIPKDKINLGAGGDATSTSEGSSLKIKIPKERLKGGDNPSEAQIHAPLKMKIRTGPSLGSNSEARKRDRDADGSPPGPPPLKKHSQATGTAGNYVHRTSVTGERQQNGRHYPGGSAGNNKVRGGGRDGRQFPSRGNYSYFRGGQKAQYNRHNISNTHYAIGTEYPHLNSSSVSSPSSAPFNTASQSLFFPGYQNPHAHNQIYNHPGFHHVSYDPCLYMQQYHQSYQLYQPHGTGNIIVTPEGTAIDTSVPPPLFNIQRNETVLSPPPPLPTGPPPENSPPPPPPPE